MSDAAQRTKDEIPATVYAVWKFKLSPVELQELLLPSHAILLTAQIQGEDLMLWAFVNVAAETRERRWIEVMGTGHIVDPGDRKYIATAQMGPLVWHVFERMR